MNLAEPLALYASLWASLTPPGTPIPFPGTAASYTHIQSNISSDQLGRFHIYASLHPELTAGKAFNIADQDKGISFEMVWKGIVGYFGLVGIGPVEGGEEKGESGEGWVRRQKDVWGSWEGENGLRKGVIEGTCWGFMTTVT